MGSTGSTENSGTPEDRLRIEEREKNELWTAIGACVGITKSRGVLTDAQVYRLLSSFAESFKV